jgi:hypothetical protein
MATYSRFNALDQVLDIQGSSFVFPTKFLSDETAGLGQAVSGQTGTGASIGAEGAITGVSGFTANSVGNFLTLEDAATPANNGTFLIIAVAGPTAITISNPSGVAGDSDVTWTERAVYSLNDDLNFQRTDRALIKGVSFDGAVPTYQRPTAVGTLLPANLANIAGHTTDAQGFIINRKYNNVSVAAADTKVTLTSVGNFKHADAVDKSGVPVFDAPPYAGDFGACYVEVLRNDGTQVVVQNGPNQGDKIFGVTNAGDAESPDSVEVLFYSVPLGGDVEADANPYTWEAGLPATVDLFYGFFSRLDQLSESSFRTISSLGVEESGSLRQDVTDIWSAVGVTDGETSLSGLTNTTGSFVFAELPASPSVTAALNTLNEHVGNRAYTGSYLTTGESVAASLQALSNAVAAGNSVRYIERLGADLTANTPHTLPGSATYTPDEDNNGRNLWVFTRGVLRDPGTVVDNDDYAETSETSITFFARQRAGDHINYVILG